MVEKRKKKPELTKTQLRKKQVSEYQDAVESSATNMKRAISSRVAIDHPWDSDTIEELNIKHRKKLSEKDPKFQRAHRAIQCRVNQDIIAMCRNAYRTQGVVKTVIELLANFVSKVNIFHANQKWERFYRAWAARVALNERLNTFVRDTLAHGMVFIYRSMASLSDSDKRNMRGAKGDIFENDNNAFLIRHGNTVKIIDPKINTIRQLGEKSFVSRESLKNYIPWEYTSLNPLQMEPTGGVVSGESQWRFMLMKDDLKAFGFKDIQNCIDEGKTLDNLPEELTTKIRQASSPLSTYELEASVPDDRLRIIYDKKFDWEKFAIPMVYPALKNLKLKDKLRNMEARAAESVISSIMLIKLGHFDNNGNFLGPPSSAVEDIGEMLREPGEATHLIWGTPDIEASYIQPNLGDIFGREKIEGIDADILADLGASEVVVNGRGGGNYSNAFLSVAAMLERLDNIREKFKSWLMHEFRLIAKSVGDNKLPSITFEISSLRDERIRNDFMLKLAQMGRLSSDTLWEYAGVDPESERAKIEREAEEITKGKLSPMKGPFKDPVAEAVMTEEMEENEDGVLPSKDEQLEREIEKTDKLAEIQEKHAPKPEGGPPKKKPTTTKKGGDKGRPPGTTDRQHQKKRDTKPKGMANLKIDKARLIKLQPESCRIATDIRKILYRKALLVSGATKRLDLSSLIIQQIEDLSNLIHSYAMYGDKIDSEYVKRFYTDGPAKLDRCVKDVLSEKMEAFTKKNGKAPSAAQKKKMTSSAWSICRASTGL